MEKKIYIAPHTECILLNTHSHLLDWSADKVPGGGGNIPEAKPVVLIEMYEDNEDTEDEKVVLPYYNIWED